VTKCLSGACRCCLQCCHRFIKFLNKNAFVQVALHSKNFCTSAMNAFLLVLKNSGTFFVSEGIGSVFIFLGKIFISVGNTAGCYLGLINWPELNSKINSPIAPMIGVFVISYIIASLFMGLFSISQNAIVQCFLTDVEISRAVGGDGTDGKHRPKELDGLVRNLTK
jgi:solute carrier family 44 (choline transporter-like protein), member 2/4/5